MPPRTLPIVLAALATSFATLACAQSTPTPPAQPTAATPVRAPQPGAPIKPLSDPRLPQIDAAIRAAESGNFNAARFGDLADHPLYRWVELASLRRNIDDVTEPRATAFLQRYQGEAVAEEFRELWLAASARRDDPAAFLKAWNDEVRSTKLRCARLDAQRQLGRIDAQWTADAQEIWNGSDGKSLPNDCDPVFAALAERGGLTDAMRWQRLEQAASAWQPGVMRAAAQGLPADQRALAEDYATFIDAPHPRALSWPKTDRSRLIASHGLAKLGKSDPDRAEALLPQYAGALDFTEADRGRAMYMIALWTVASYLPESERRLNAVPAASYDARLHEWRVREAMSRSDWPAALAAIRKMSDEQRSDSTYEYFEGRLAELTGDEATAQARYAAAAREPEFHGFLAADRINQPYALCPWEVQADAASLATVANDPALQRAIGLHQLERHGWAVEEWAEATEDFSDTQRQLAVKIAQANGWFDRAVFALGDGPRENQLYTLRFPLHHDATIRREAARNDIDPAWVAAEIRAESIFNPRARSGANAMGLMQVLPATGAAVARRIGQPWNGSQSLYDADTNIVLGTAYLRQMLDEYGGKPYFAIAGYNAGPTPLARWQAQRPGMDPDFWIETISYHETRDYVARVLAFAVIYDWLLEGDALRLSDRMQGKLDGPRKTFECPATPP
ncbi:lytic transglycosylase domain-containing protein [Novilysobacter erysipheiresistens]|uniref:Transglycosylase SLT domain-containing protein n=1 Tax=Novilysobacter erysipheiresistens TaxID=1749332 RepID=A0ABU7Z033_9GAMM